MPTHPISPDVGASDEAGRDAAHAKPFSPFDTGDYQSRSAAEDAVGTIIAGKYKLIERIGEGGMGTVWMAQQTEPVKRSVAVKLIKKGMDSKHVVARFEVERQALAVMDHPNIAKVLDAGTIESPDLASAGPDAAIGLIGRPYFVMELVKGVPITKYCDQNKLTPRQRLELFVPVCQAIQHAHQKGIIHRDIKPSNVMVALYDDKPVPKVIDFGVAKATGQALTEQTLNTGLGGIVGTPEYMSPEQASLNNLDIDTRTDVYSLGVLLYELLAGSPPFKRNDLQQIGLLEILRVICEDEPPRPSTKLSTADALPSISANRGTEPKKLTGLLRNELDWIVMKALEKDRSRRYETANGFAADINRYLAGEPVNAHPPSSAYRLKKFLRKHKGPVIAASLVVIALLAGIVGTTWGFFRADHERQVAVKAREAEAEQRRQAEQANLGALQALRSFTDDLMEKQIASKNELSKNETSLLRNALKQWDVFAQSKGDSADARAIRAEGASRVAALQGKLGLKADAEANYRTALTIIDQLVAEFPTNRQYRSELAQTEAYLGSVLMDRNQFPESEEHLLAALKIQEKLVAEFTTVPEYLVEFAKFYGNLGNLKVRSGKRVDAETHFRQALAIQEKLVAEAASENNVANLAQSHNNLGLLLSELAKMAEAEEQYLKCVAIRTKLADDYPDVPTHGYNLAYIRCNLGNLLTDTGKPARAEEQYDNALAILNKLVAAYPSMPQYRFELGRTYGLLADLFNSLDKREKAEEHYRKSLTHREKLTVDFPTVPLYRSSLSNCRTNFASLLNRMSKREEAEDQFRLAVAIQQKLVDDYANVPNYKIALGTGLYNFGNLHLNNGKLNEGLALFEQAIRILTPVYEQDKRLASAKRFLRNGYWGRAMAFDRLERYTEAATDWGAAMELSGPTEQPVLRFNRANSRLRAEQHVAESIQEIDELAKLDTWNPQQWYVFACTYVVASTKDEARKEEHLTRAIDLLRKAMKAGFKDRDQIESNKDLDIVRGRADFKKLIAELETNAKVKE